MSQYYFFEYEDIQTIQRWHESLDKNRGDRARLRRAESPEDVLLTAAFFNFLEEMKATNWQEHIPILTMATIAGVLSHVKPNGENKSFAEQLATPLEGKKKAPMSELRFQQLQKSPSPEYFYRRIIRAIQLLKGQVNIVSLSHDIIQWHKEFEHPVSHSPTKRLAVRWATDYFTALAKIKS